MTVGTILKSLLPRALRKRLFLSYNRLKKHTWDRLFFPEYKLRPDDFQLYEKKNPFLEQNTPVSHLPEEVRQRLEIWQNPGWTQDQFILEFGRPGFIEPRAGWGIVDHHRLIYPSLGLASAPHVHKPSTFETYFRKDIVKLKKVISLRDTGEENYFHFFNDVLPKLFLLGEKGYVLGDYTIVVSRQLYKKNYFQHYLRHTWLGSLKWHTQNDEWIHFDHAVFCKPYTHTRRYFDQAVDMLPAASMTYDRKIFLTRGKNSGRFISNMDELGPVLKNFGFEILDTAAMAFEEQVRIFSNTSHLAGIHGAGLTNMIFRKNKPLAIFELLHPFEYVPFHYIMMAKVFGFSYDAILGTQGKAGGFVISPAVLNDHLRKISMIK